MQYSFISKIKTLRKRYNYIKDLIINKKIKKINKKKSLDLYTEYSKINLIMEKFKAWNKIQENIKETEILLKEKEMYDIAKEELECLQEQLNLIENKIKSSLEEMDNSKHNCFLEIRAATGGNEASLFAKDLFRMYSRFIDINKWNMDIININYGDLGGYKEVIVKIKNPEAYEILKSESGGHRVQRIPKTESQGRIHTSSCTVAVIPVVKDIQDIKININDIKIDFFKSSGAGGQHVNTTDSAVRLTHLPTGLVVECQNERSQHKNKSKALEVLVSRLKAEEIKRRKNSESYLRKSLLGSGDRSDRIRTYNYPQKRITDHRLNVTIYQLYEVMNGKLNLINKYTYKKY